MYASSHPVRSFSQPRSIHSDSSIMISLISPIQDAKAFFDRNSTQGRVTLSAVNSFFEREGADWEKLAAAVSLEVQRASAARTKGSSRNLLLSIADTVEEDEDNTNAGDAGERLQHIVLFSFRKDATEAELSHASRLIMSFHGIPGVVDVKFGAVKTALYPNMRDRSGGFTHVLHVVTTGARALELYDTHPLHEHVRDDVLKPLSTKPAMALDFFPVF